jgi:hypothetical protein
MNETLINAKLSTLEHQRNNALNQVVNLTADLAACQAQAAQFKDLADKAIARVAELEAKAEPAPAKRTRKPRKEQSHGN